MTRSNFAVIVDTRQWGRQGIYLVEFFYSPSASDLVFVSAFPTVKMIRDRISGIPLLTVDEANRQHPDWRAEYARITDESINILE